MNEQKVVKKKKKKMMMMIVYAVHLEKDFVEFSLHPSYDGFDAHL